MQEILSVEIYERKEESIFAKNVTFIKIGIHAIHDVCRLFPLLENNGISHDESKSYIEKYQVAVRKFSVSVLVKVVATQTFDIILYSRILN